VRRRLVVVGKRYREAVLAVAALLKGPLIRGVISVLVHRARPSRSDWLTGAGGYAFPSGHTTTAVLAWGLVVALAWPWLRTRAYRAAACLAAAAIAIVVGLTRAYLGVRWLTDVVGGWTLGGLLLSAAVAALSFAQSAHLPGRAAVLRRMRALAAHVAADSNQGADDLFGNALRPLPRVTACWVGVRDCGVNEPAARAHGDAALDLPGTTPRRRPRMRAAIVLVVVGLAAVLVIGSGGVAEFGSRLVGLRWQYAAIVISLGALHYLAAAFASRAVSGVRLPLGEAVLVQLAAAAANRIASVGLGGATVNARYSPAVASTSRKRSARQVP
jgi:hypothetical protein